MIMLLLGGNPQPVFLAEKLPKKIRAHVHDDERKKQMLFLYHQYEKEVSGLKKEYARTRKDIRKLNLSRKTPQDTLFQLLTLSADLYKQILLKGIPYRMKLQKLMLPEEWAAIAGSTEHYPEDSIQKNLSLFVLTETAEYEQILTEYMSDPFRETEVIKASQQFSDDLIGFIHKNSDTIAVNLSIFYNQDAEEADVENAVEFVNMEKDEIFSSLYNYNHVMKYYITSEEWFQIAKKINRRYK